MADVRRLFSLLRQAYSAGIVPTLKALEASLSPSRPQISYIETELGNYYVVGNDYLSKSLAANERHELHFQQFTELILRESDNVLDLGANLGTHSIWMSRLAPNGKVFAFEPLSLVFSQLQLNLIASDVVNAFTYKFAVSDSTGSYLQMEPINYTSKDLNVGSTRVSNVGNGDGVLSVRLDDLNLPPINFVKMDIQGSEYRALLGMARLIAKDRPLIFIEIEEALLRACGTSSKQLIEHILALEYTMFRIQTVYPCDHIAIPNEKLGDYEALISTGFPYVMDRIQGREVDLVFADSKFTYSEIRVR